MKILHINSYYSTTKLYTDMYQHQRDAGIPFQVYVPISNQYPEEKLKVTPADDITVSRCFNKNDRFIFQVKHKKILQDLLEKFNPEEYTLLHAHSLFSNGWLAYQLNKRYGIPYVVAVRSADERTFFGKMPWMRKTGIDIMKNASQIVYISKNTQNIVMENYVPSKYQEEFSAKTHVIPNGIDEFWHQHQYANKLPVVHNPLRIISVARLHPEKRLVPLAEMTKMYNDNYGPLELHIVGSNDTDKIKKELCQFDHVTYHGQKSKEEILQLFREMDIFALLSTRETFGLVYVEAMSQGLPIIYSKNEGFDSFFESGAVGISVQNNDHLGLNQAIDHIYVNYEKLSQNAVKESAQFNWPEIIQTYKDIYQSISKEQIND